VSKPFGVGAYAYQRLNLVAKGKAHGRNSQGFKPDLRNSAVRHYRGASENVATAELRTHLATERVRVVTLRLKQTRPSSIPTINKALPASSRLGTMRSEADPETLLRVE
jgi:hypothetical protein